VGRLFDPYTKLGAVMIWIVFIVAIFGAIAVAATIDEHYGGKAAGAFAVGCVFAYIGIPVVFLGESKKVGLALIVFAFLIAIVEFGLVGGHTLRTIVNDL
jgi:hypothetical protein